MTHYVEKSALISSDGNYRYQLWRRWGPLHDYALWVMLNPSTADAHTDDRTIARCVAFSKAWGYHGLIVINKFAFRSTDPAALKTVADPRGPDNDLWLRQSAMNARTVICAWGKPGGIELPRALFPTAPFTFYCLGINSDGSPKHPLYLPSSTPLSVWRHYP